MACLCLMVYKFTCPWDWDVYQPRPTHCPRYIYYMYPLTRATGVLQVSYFPHLVVLCNYYSFCSYLIIFISISLVLQHCFGLVVIVVYTNQRLHNTYMTLYSAVVVY